MTTRLLRYLTALGLLFIALAAPASSPVPPGFLEGRLKIETPGGAEPADKDSGRPERSYADYPLIVLSKEGRNEVAQVPVDKQGRYRVALPPGDYVLDVKGGGRRRPRITPHPFKIVSQQTLRVDMEIGADPRVM